MRYKVADRKWIGGAIILLGLICGSVQAEQGEKSIHSSGDSEWQFELRPYAWALGSEGFIERNDRIGSDYDLSIGDVVDTLDELEMIAMAELTARKGRTSFTVDMIYGKWENLTTGDLNLTSPVPGRDLDLTWETLLLQFGAGYTLCEFSTPDGRRSSLDIKGGGRYVYISGNDTIAGPEGRVEIGLGGSENFWEPWIGTEIGVELTQCTRLVLGGDIGGFGTADSVGTNWQAYAMLQYQLTPNILLDAGYRHMDLEYEDSFKGGSLNYAIEGYGPVIGVTYKF